MRVGPKRLVGVLGACVVSLLAVSGVAAAQQNTTGPSVVLARSELAPGERLDFSLEGFGGPAVVISICGNDALRGSVDCNVIQSEGLRLNRDGGTTVSSIPVAVPPAACPCLVRVVDSDNTQLAVAPLVIVGHPVAPTVGPAGFVQPLVVEVSAEKAPAGISAQLRSSAAGATSYSVVVRVRNRSSQPVARVVLAGSVGRDPDEDLAILDLDDPGTIKPGQTWQEKVQTELPSPVWGEVVWQATASGAGPSVTATTTTTHRPALLIVLIVVLIVDILLLLARLILRLRRRAAQTGDDQPDNPFIDDPDIGGAGSAAVETDLLQVDSSGSDAPERASELVS